MPNMYGKGYFFTTAQKQSHRQGKTYSIPGGRGMQFMKTEALPILVYKLIYLFP